MMNSALRNAVKASFDASVDLLGTTLEWTKADGSGSATIVAGFRVVGRDDLAIINAYGVDTRVVTISADTASIVPEQFDTFLAHGLPYVVQSANEVWLNDDLIGYRCYCRGR